MAFIGKPVNLLAKVLTLAFLAGLGLGLPARAEEAYVVAPVLKAEDLRLLPASAWPPEGAEGPELLVKLTYLRGMLDALQYVEVAPRQAAKVLKGLSGQNLGQLAEALDRYYLADPRRRELPPAAVLLRILSEQAGAPEASPLPAPTPPAPPKP